MTLSSLVSPADFCIHLTPSWALSGPTSLFVSYKGKAGTEWITFFDRRILLIHMATFSGVDWFKKHRLSHERVLSMPRGFRHCHDVLSTVLLWQGFWVPGFVHLLSFPHLLFPLYLFLFLWSGWFTLRWSHQSCWFFSRLPSFLPFYTISKKKWFFNRHTVKALPSFIVEFFRQIRRYKVL